MIKLGTLFSGIGAVEQAFQKLKIEHKIVFACDNGERELDIDIETVKKDIEDMSPIEIKQHIDNIYSKLKKPNYMEFSYKNNYEINDDDFHKMLEGCDLKSKEFLKLQKKASKFNVW